MLESVFQRVLRAVFGGGADISALNPLPVTETAGGKGSAGVLDQATILAGVTTRLYDCVALDLSDCPKQLCLTIEVMYDAIATAGIRVHVISSYGDSTGGTHTGGMGVAVLTDVNNHFPIPDGLEDLTVVNSTDGSTAPITANTINTVTAALGGGIANVWNTGDIYYINGAGYDSEDFDVWSPAFVAGTFIRQTRPYLSDPRNLKVLIENLDPARPVTFVIAAFTYQM